MRRFLASSVIAMTVAVTVPALADPPAATPAGPAPAPAPTIAYPTVPVAPTVTAPVVAPAAAPIVAAVAPAKAASAPVVAAPVTAPAPAHVSIAAATPGPAAVAPVTAPAAAAPVVATPVAAPVAATETPLALRPAAPLTLAAEPAPTPWGYKLLFGAAIIGAGVIMWRRRRALAATDKASTPVRILGKTSMGLRGELALVEVGGMRLLVGVTPSSMQTLAVLSDDLVEAAEAAELVRDRDSRAPARPGHAALDRSGTAPSTETKEAPSRFDLASRARSLFASFDVGPPVPPRVAASGFAASRYADERDDGPPDSAPAPNTKARAAEREPEPRDREADRRRRTPRDQPLEGQARGIALALGNRR